MDFGIVFEHGLPQEGKVLLAADERGRGLVVFDAERFGLGILFGP